jgi:xanthine dehydrogenase accessory factor
VSEAGARVGVAEAARAALDARAGGRAAAVVSRCDEGGDGRRLLVYAPDDCRGTLGDPVLDAAGRALGAELLGRDGDAAGTVEAGDATLYGEAHRRPATLFVVGAGHIALPLARIGALVGFRVVVLDDREDFATGERFPEAAEVVRLDFEEPFGDVTVTAADFVVLVTRAHRYDFDCLVRLVEAPEQPRYIGMVGSRRRVRAAFRALLEAGVPRDRLEGVHAPIGLDIGAETPEEIAVSIVAELVTIRRGGTGGSLRDRERVIDRL